MTAEHLNEKKVAVSSDFNSTYYRWMSCPKGNTTESKMLSQRTTIFTRLFSTTGIEKTWPLEMSFHFLTTCPVNRMVNDQNKIVDNLSKCCKSKIWLTKFRAGEGKSKTLPNEGNWGNVGCRSISNDFSFKKNHRTFLMQKHKTDFIIKIAVQSF